MLHPKGGPFVFATNGHDSTRNERTNVLLLVYHQAITNGKDAIPDHHGVIHDVDEPSIVRSRV